MRHETNNISNRTIDLPMPSPDFSPDEVVALQLEALQFNNEDDDGIEVAFNFASPGNKEVTGPLEKYKSLIKNPLYAVLINFQNYCADDIHIEDDLAQQIVVLTDRDGEKAGFIFSLSKQTEAPFQNCWMIDGVLRLEIKPGTFDF